MGTFLGLLLTIIYIYIFFFLGLCLQFDGKPTKRLYNDCCVLGTPPEFWEVKKRHGKIISENPDKMTEPITFLLG